MFINLQYVYHIYFGKNLFSDLKEWISKKVKGRRGKKNSIYKLTIKIKLYGVLLYRVYTETLQPVKQALHLFGHKMLTQKILG